MPFLRSVFVRSGCIPFSACLAFRNFVHVWQPRDARVTAPALPVSARRLAVSFGEGGRWPEAASRGHPGRSRVREVGGDTCLGRPCWVEPRCLGSFVGSWEKAVLQVYADPSVGVVVNYIG